MNVKKHIPNALTSANLLCGCIAIVQAMNGNLVWAAYLVGMAAVFDFFDGFAARLLKVSSPIGKDLDSLADMVTFGVVPGIVVFQLFSISENPWNGIIPYVAFLIPVFSALRLAKFNNDNRQSDSFIGVPTPANSILICSLPLIINNSVLWRSIILNPYLLLITTLVMSFLLIAELPLIALKFKHFKWKENEVRFIFIGLCGLFLSLFQFIGIPLCILLYIVVSVINNLIRKENSNLTN